LSALVAIANTAGRSVATSRSHTIADQYVRGGVESLRQLRDNNGWDGLTSMGGGAAELAPGIPKYYSLGNSGLPVYQPLIPATDTQPCTYNNVVQTPSFELNNGYYRLVHMELNGAGDEVEMKVTVCF